MNGLEFLRALVHLLTHNVGPIFGELQKDFRGLENREVSGEDVTKAFEAFLRSRFPAFLASSFRAPFLVMLRAQPGPVMTCQALQAFMDMTLYQGDEQGSRSWLEDERRAEAVDMVRQFLKALAGEALPTVEEMAQAEAERQQVCASWIRVHLNWGSSMCNEANVLLVAAYLHSIPPEERQQALLVVATHIDGFLQKEKLRYEKQSEGVERPSLQEVVAAELRVVCVVDNAAADRPVGDG